MKIFCFGFGQVARHFVKKLVKENVKFELNITTRNKSASLKFDKIEYNAFQFSKERKDKNVIKKIFEASHILISVPPVEEQDIVIENFKEVIRETKTKWITYLSATSVYGNHNGAWVDENSETNPISMNGKSRLSAEREWLAFSKEYNLPTQILRLSGIYSNDNNILKRLLSGEARIVKKKDHFFSRIHIEDIANILFLFLNKFKRNEIFNISDDKPASQEELAIFGSKLLKIDTPKLLDIDDLEEGMLKDFYRDSKKVDNKKMKRFFNYKLLYPTFKEGLIKIFNQII